MEDVRQRHISEFYPAWALELISATAIPEAVRTGLWMGESALLRHDGTEIPVSQLLIAHRSKTGEVEYLSTIMRDLTEQKRTEDALRQREETLRMAQQVGNVGSWERDLQRDDAELVRADVPHPGPGPAAFRSHARELARAGAPRRSAAPAGRHPKTRSPGAGRS